MIAVIAVLVGLLGFAFFAALSDNGEESFLSKEDYKHKYEQALDHWTRVNQNNASHDRLCEVVNDAVTYAAKSGDEKAVHDALHLQRNQGCQ